MKDLRAVAIQWNSVKRGTESSRLLIDSFVAINCVNLAVVSFISLTDPAIVGSPHGSGPWRHQRVQDEWLHLHFAVLLSLKIGENSGSGRVTVTRSPVHIRSAPVEQMTVAVCWLNEWFWFTAQSVCYEELGCVTVNASWYSIFRPVNRLPLARTVINTSFVLHTRELPTQVNGPPVNWQNVPLIKHGIASV